MDDLRPLSPQEESAVKPSDALDVFFAAIAPQKRLPNRAYPSRETPDVVIKSLSRTGPLMLEFE
jgi:hypothetical protein